MYVYHDKLKSSVWRKTYNNNKNGIGERNVGQQNPKKSKTLSLSLILYTLHTCMTWVRNIESVHI